MRGVLITMLVFAASEAAAQTVDLVPQSEETYQQYSASVPIGGAGDGAAKDLDLEILLSSTGRVADLAVTNANKGCIKVQIGPNQWMLIGCGDGGGFPPPPVMSPVLVEIDPLGETSTAAGSAPVANLTVQAIDLGALEDGQTFDLIPRQ